MTKRKIRSSDVSTPAPSPDATGTTAAPSAESESTPSVASAPASSPEQPTKPRRVSAPVEIARALSRARSSGEIDIAETLAEIEARAAAAHARELAAAEASVPAGEGIDSQAASIADASRPHVRAIAPDDDEDEDDEDLYDDRWDDDAYAQHRGPRRPLRERARGRTGHVELLMFRVGNERFAVELLCVEEAIDLGAPHHVPEMPPAMLGVITVRGTLTPVFTPDEALGVAAVSKGAALIFRSDRGRFALAIDDVDDVMTLDLAQLRDAPGIDGSDSLMLGVARNGSGIVALVDAEALIAACQATPIPELV
jgi:purine-binding chemotaxis protein CheW